MSRHILKTGLDLDFQLLAIACNIKGYRLCYYINELLPLTFERSREDHAVPDDAGGMKYYEKYEYHATDHDISLYLVGNGGSTGNLVPDMPQFDFFLIIYGFYEHEDLAELLKTLKGLRDVQAVAEVQPEKLKYAENLIIQ